MQSIYVPIWCLAGIKLGAAMVLKGAAMVLAREKVKRVARGVEQGWTRGEKVMKTSVPMGTYNLYWLYTRFMPQYTFFGSKNPILKSQK